MIYRVNLEYSPDIQAISSLKSKNRVSIRNILLNVNKSFDLKFTKQYNNYRR